jgi:hypothetical protein
MHDRKITLDPRGQTVVPAGGVAGPEFARQHTPGLRIHEVAQHREWDGGDEDGKDGRGRCLDVVQVDGLGRDES